MRKFIEEYGHREAKVILVELIKQTVFNTVNSPEAITNSTEGQFALLFCLLEEMEQTSPSKSNRNER